MTANDYPERTPEQRAWQEAHAQHREEMWLALHRKLSDKAEAWRMCTLRHCRRRHCCSDDSLICLDILFRKRPRPAMTPQQLARAQFELRKAVERANIALAGEKKLREEAAAKRFEEIRREKLAAYGIAVDGKAK
ncbi:MAG: hypothetical protein ABWY14_16590 [Tardiphaga sp.]